MLRFYLITNSYILNYFCNFSLFKKLQKLQSSDSFFFFKVGALRNFANFPGKNLRQSLFLLRFKASNFLKRDSSTGVFLWNLQNFENPLFHRTPLLAASGKLWNRFLNQRLQKIKFQKKTQHVKPPDWLCNLIFSRAIWVNRAQIP